MNKKSVIAGSVLIVALLLVGAALGGWKYLGIKAAANQHGGEPPEFVEVITAESTTWQPKSRLVGTVIAKRSVTLANEIVGVVTEVGFDSGDEVQPGQVLIKLDASSELADLAGAQASERLSSAAIGVAQADIHVAEAELALAKSSHKRVTDAAASESVTPAEMDRANADLAKATADLERQKSSLVRAQAELDQAKARADQIRTILAKKTLASPFRARAGMRTIHPGQYLAEGTSIVGLTEVTDDIYLDFAVPQEYGSRVTPGAVVVASSNVLGGDAVAITVVSVDATVNPTTRNVRVRSSVPNPGNRLKPGMFIDVEVPVEAAKPYVTVPTTAVRRAAFGDHVFVLVPGDPQKDPPGAMRAQQRMVTLGADLGGRIIVESGLKMGEQIAAAGSFKLREGAMVMKAPPTGPHGAPATPAKPDAAAKPDPAAKPDAAAKGEAPAGGDR